MSTYAEVVVNDPLSRLAAGETASDIAAPLGMTYHYDVPPHLRGVLQPGHLVWVPFGERQLQGIVIGLSQTTPVAETRPLERLALDEPVLTDTQLALARWMSGYYLAPLLDCLRLMLPPGLLRPAEPLLEALLAPPFPADLTPEQVELLNRLQEGPLPLRRLKRTAPGLAAPAVIEPLLQRGLVSRRQAVVRPPLQPKVGRRVRLLADAGEVARVLPTLGHASKQADVLSWLAASPDPLPTVAAVCQAVGCTEGPLQALAERGWVEIIPRRRLLVLLLSPQAVDGVLESELCRAPQQAAALAALRGYPDPVDEAAFRARHNVSAATLRALEARGILRRVEEEPRALLCLEPEEVAERVVELRGASKHRAVLDAMLELADEVGEGEPVMEWIGWVYAETDCSLDTLRDLEAAGLIAIEEEEIWRDPLAGQEFVPDTPPKLTSDQDAVWRVVEEAIRRQGDSPPLLLHGVTGSGKTEIYLRAIARMLSAGRQAIVLVPEISLTPQTIRRFAARFPGRIGVIHSELSRGERYDTWRRIRAGQVDIVIGPRSALFQPLPRLGLIIMDEEHDGSYKQDDLLSRQLVRYHARQVAWQLARLSGALLIPGSATPSLEAYHAARAGRVRLLELPQRILGHQRRLEEQRERYHVRDTVYKPLASDSDARYVELPRVEVVDLRQELRAGNRSIFSRALQEALARVLAARQQAILFLNRRGAATFVMCRDCGHVLRCPRCDVPLTYHLEHPQSAIHNPQSTLVCHHCNRRQPVPERCPACDSRRIRHFGVGTQQVEAEVRRMFPQARTLRWDWDVTRFKGAHEVILSRFSQHQADMLIGTQMIAKGLDLPLVTLVGVVSADTALYLPDFRASERTFQLLTQVAGRAGRGILGGRVIVQTYTPEHYAIRAAAGHDYAAFYGQEIACRRQLGYPPAVRLAKVVAVDENPRRCRQSAEAVADLLAERIAGRGGEASLIGPVPCFFARHRRRSRWQVIVRASDPTALLRGLSLPPNCWVDVDPVSLL
ncbi:MAG: primosomal protein N' [Anaerolineae bacterium]|nr:primosomal protein N' [Anaerolineae bacterium]